jgi:hypothetical protein
MDRLPISLSRMFGSGSPVSTRSGGLQFNNWNAPRYGGPFWREKSDRLAHDFRFSQ